MGDVLKNIELIEQYFEGKLSEKERIDFEAKLLIDAEFKKEYEFYTHIVAGIKEAGEDKLREKLKIADRELDSGKVISIERKSNFKTLALAASLIFLIGLSVIWYF